MLKINELVVRVHDTVYEDFCDVIEQNGLNKKRLSSLRPWKLFNITYRLIRGCSTEIKAKGLVDKYIQLINELVDFSDKLITHYTTLVEREKKSLESVGNDDIGCLKRKLKKSVINALGVEIREIKRCADTDFKRLKAILEDKYKILYARNSSGVIAKFKFEGKDNYWDYSFRDRRLVTKNKDKDSDIYPVKVSLNYMDEFLRLNNVNEMELSIDPNSLKRYYGFYNKYSSNLTPAFVNEWWNCDCPDLYRYTPNLENGTNMFGMYLLEFSNQLVNASWAGTYIDKSITPEEVQALTKGHEGTLVAKEMFNVLEARGVTLAEKKKLEEWVKSFEQRIQSVIDDNKEAIKQYLVEKFPQRVKSLEPLVIDDNFGLDCGWVNIYTTNKEYVEKKGILKNLQEFRSDNLGVKMPFSFQSTTVQRTMFDKIQELVEKATGIRLYSKTILD
jgi:hypothetical protein